MKEQKYFLRLENATVAWFETIKDCIKVFVPSKMPRKFHKLNTETSVKLIGTTPEEDRKVLKKIYKNYDIFYLNIVSETEFDLCDNAESCCALVCISKKEQGYKEKPQEYIDFVRIVLENYYNNVKDWQFLVMDKDCEKFKNDKSRKYYDYVIDEYVLFRFNGVFIKEDKEFFEKCKTKYGIPQSEISLAKNIIKSYKNSKKHTYSITPELIKKLQKTKNTKDQ